MEKFFLNHECTVKKKLFSWKQKVDYKTIIDPFFSVNKLFYIIYIVIYNTYFVIYNVLIFDDRGLLGIKSTNTNAMSINLAVQNILVYLTCVF